MVNSIKCFLCIQCCHKHSTTTLYKILNTLTEAYLIKRLLEFLKIKFTTYVQCFDRNELVTFRGEKVKGQGHDEMVRWSKIICSKRTFPAKAYGPTGWRFAAPGPHWPAEHFLRITYHQMWPPITYVELWSKVPLHCWNCLVVIRMWNSSEEFRQY